MYDLKFHIGKKMSWTSAKKCLLHRKYRTSYLWFFEAVYMLSLFRNTFWIRKRRPHLSERKSFHLHFCETQNKALKFKGSQKFENLCLWFFLLWADLSCNSCFEKVCLSENGARYFWKKAFVAIISMSLKIDLESRKWQSLPGPGAPGLM